MTMNNNQWKEAVIEMLNKTFPGCNAAEDDRRNECVWVGAPSATGKSSYDRAEAIQEELNKGFGGEAECISSKKGRGCEYVRISPPAHYPKVPAADATATEQDDTKEHNSNKDGVENKRQGYGGGGKLGDILQTIEKQLQKHQISPLDPNLQIGVGPCLPLNCILCGPPGTGKTFAAKNLLEKIKEANRYAEVCFHPATAYEDFVRAVQSDGKGNFVAVNKVFGDICDRALVEPKKLFAILIDEINRANLPAVMGELMTALEYRGHEVDLPHAVERKDEKGNENRKAGQLIVPPNLLVIGTMNTADRSTGLLDYALRRRFVFFPMKPRLDRVEGHAKKTFEKVLGLFYTDVKNLKGRAVHLAPDFEPDDVAIGHSYFMGDNWKFKAKYQVAPLLEEYLRDGILTEKVTVSEVINSLRFL